MEPSRAAPDSSVETTCPPQLLTARLRAIELASSQEIALTLERSSPAASNCNAPSLSPGKLPHLPKRIPIARPLARHPMAPTLPSIQPGRCRPAFRSFCREWYASNKKEASNKELGVSRLSRVLCAKV